MNISPGTAILVLTCNRPDYLRRTLRSIDRANRALLPVIISQDGTDEATTAAIRDYGRAAAHLQHERKMSNQGWPTGIKGPFDIDHYHQWRGYYHISRHYKWAFHQTFDRMGLDNIIVIEDDLELAPDFFTYFQSCTQLLELDATVRTISAWNDNGRPPLVTDPAQLYRTDFFPGLGWLMTRRLWDALAPDWPDTFWDDWMRLVFRREGWVAIMPEIARTHTFGEVGVSEGQFYHDYLKPMRLNDQAVDFGTLDLGFLVKARYDAWLHKAIMGARLMPPEQALATVLPGDRRLLYHGEESFAAIARLFGLMPDFRVGMPRTSYQGIVAFRCQAARIFIVPLSYLIAESRQKRVLDSF